jgi:hypothetical protein
MAGGCSGAEGRPVKVSDEHRVTARGRSPMLFGFLVYAICLLVVAGLVLIFYFAAEGF